MNKFFFLEGRNLFFDSEILIRTQRPVVLAGPRIGVGEGGNDFGAAPPAASVDP